MRVNDWVRYRFPKDKSAWLEGRLAKIDSEGKLWIRQAYLVCEDGDEIVMEYLHGGIQTGFSPEHLEVIPTPEAYKNWRLA